MRQLERVLGISRQNLRAVGRTASLFYQPFLLKKTALPFARTGKSAKPRLIDQPVGELRKIQDRIYQKLLAPIELPGYMSGGIRHRSVLSNVRFHGDPALMITIDIQQWFPSITPQHVYNVWRHVLDCSREISDLLTNLTTIDGRLPQGAPTSSALANLALYSIDGPIRMAAARLGVKYSAYVDDLTFSGVNARSIIPIVIATLGRSGFRVSRRKLRVMGPGETKTLNGVVVGKNPRAPRKLLSRLRAGIDKLERDVILRDERKRYDAALGGRINYLLSIDPKRGRSFKIRFDTLSASGNSVKPATQIKSSR